MLRRPLARYIVGTKLFETTNFPSGPENPAGSAKQQGFRRPFSAQAGCLRHTSSRILESETICVDSEFLDFEFPGV